jgi:hypothetical protein
MKADRDAPKALRDFDHREKMRTKIRRRLDGIRPGDRAHSHVPALQHRLARADRRLAEARTLVDGV